MAEVPKAQNGIWPAYKNTIRPSGLWVEGFGGFKMAFKDRGTSLFNF